MSSAAQRDETSTTYPPTGTDGGTALRQLAAERLAAHRNRRAVTETPETQARREQAEAQGRNSAACPSRGCTSGRPFRRHTRPRGRCRAVSRYEQSLSYKEFLAAEAERAIAQAEAQAEVAARTARAVTAAQRQLLEEIEQWNLEDSASCSGPATLFNDLPVLEVVEPREASSSDRSPLAGYVCSITHACATARSDARRRRAGAAWRKLPRTFAARAGRGRRARRTG